MSIKDGFKFGIGYALGQAFLLVLAKSIVAAVEKKETEENE